MCRNAEIEDSRRRFIDWTRRYSRSQMQDRHWLRVRICPTISVPMRLYVHSRGLFSAGPRIDIRTVPEIFFFLTLSSHLISTARRGTGMEKCGASHPQRIRSLGAPESRSRHAPGAPQMHIAPVGMGKGRRAWRSCMESAGAPQLVVLLNRVKRRSYFGGIFPDICSTYKNLYDHDDRLERLC